LGPALGLALLWREPLAAVPVVSVAVARVLLEKRSQLRDEQVASWLRTTAAELRAGASLRSALVAGGAVHTGLGLGRVERLAAAGRPIVEVGEAMRSIAGMEAAAAVLEVTAVTGGSVAPVLEALAVEAGDEAGLVAERRTLTVAARWSIGLVAGFPLVVLAVQIARGEVARLLGAGGLATLLVILGMGLLLAGIATAALLLRRARS